MKKVQRQELLDFQSYGDVRDEIRQKVMAEKDKRRVHLGSALTFLFENPDTVRYQVQEMMRVERIAREADILHELSTYNQLLGDEGELGCTLLIEIDDAKERDRLLVEWLDLPRHLYMVTASGERARAMWDPAQIGEGRLSSVQYLKFPVGAQTPKAIGVDHPAITLEVALDEVQRAALTADLGLG